MSTRVHIDLNSGVVLLGSAVVPCVVAGANGEVRVDGGRLLRPLPFAERSRLVWLAAAAADAEAVLAESVLAFATVEPAERRAYDDVVALALAGAGEEAASFDETLATAARAAGLSLDELLVAPARTVDALARVDDGREWSRILFAQPTAEADWASMRAEFCGQLLRRLRPASVWRHDALEVIRRAPVPPRAFVASMDTQVAEEATRPRPVTPLRATLEAPAVHVGALSQAPAPPAPSLSVKGVHVGERVLTGASDSPPTQAEPHLHAHFSTTAAPRRTIEPAVPSSVQAGGTSPVLTPRSERTTLATDAPLALTPHGEHTTLATEAPPALFRAGERPGLEPIRWTHRAASAATVETPSVPPMQQLPSLADIADIIGELLHHEADLRGID
jgi:hypothetical protein